MPMLAAESGLLWTVLVVLLIVAVVLYIVRR
jgi:hypothetical protein